MSRSFFDFFPPPKFLEMPAAGISVSDDAVRFIEFKPKKGILLLNSWAEHPLEKGTVLGGIIQDQEKFLDVLKKLASDKKVKRARVALPEEKSFVYTAKVTVPEGADIRTAVEFTLSDNIPLAPAETIFDFSVVGADKQTGTVDVAVYAFPESIATAYAMNFLKAGITPLIFETESQAIARSVTPRDQKGAFLLLHIDSRKAILAVTLNGRVEFASVSEIPPSSDLTIIKDELKKIASYWHTERAAKSGGRSKIQTVIISGNVSKMPDLPDTLANHLNIPARFADIWQNAFSTNSFIPEITLDESLPFDLATGLALTHHND